MHRYNDLGSNRPLKGGCYIANDAAGGPPLPDSKITLQQLPQQDPLDESTHRQSMGNEDHVDGALGQAAVNSNTGALLDTETKKNQPEMSANGLVNGHPGRESDVINGNTLSQDSIRSNARMVQEYEKPKGYNPKGKSDFSASAYAVPQGMTGEARMEACVEPVLNYDRGNIGPRSSGQYPGQMNIQSDKPNFGQPGSAMYKHVPWYYKPMRASWLPAAFQTRRLIESWREAKTVSSNRRSGRPNFDEFMNTSNNTAMAKVSNCAATIDQKQRTSSSDARSQQAGSYPENQCVSIQQSSDEVCDRQAAVYQPQSAKKRSTNVRGAQFSPSLIDGNIKNNDHINAGINKAKAAPQYPQEFLYDGSESATSESSQDDQQHLYELTQKNEKRQEAKQYMIEAIEHLVEMCNAYGDEIDEADKNEIMNEILEAIGGCKTFKAAIEKRTLGATTNTPDQQFVETQATCSKCEEQEARMKKAVDALLGV